MAEKKNNWIQRSSSWSAPTSRPPLPVHTRQPPWLSSLPHKTRHILAAGIPHLQMPFPQQSLPLTHPPNKTVIHLVYTSSLSVSSQYLLQPRSTCFLFRTPYYPPPEQGAANSMALPCLSALTSDEFTAGPRRGTRIIPSRTDLSGAGQNLPFSPHNSGKHFLF